MAKIGIFKKIAALATAIAIVVCFAVSAGAVSVTTTTSYVNGANGDISVEVTIIGDDIAGKNVSYYAYKGTDPVHIDQIDDFNGNETISYVTSDANLNSEVKVGYTGASVATPSQIDGDKVEWNGTPVYIPTKATAATVRFATSATSVVPGYNATGATITSAEITSGYLTVVLSNISAEKENINLTIETKTEAVVQLIDAAFVYSNGHDDIASGVDTEVGDRKLTAIGKVKGNPTEFGIIVTADSSNPAADDKYKAVASTVDVANKTAEGYYAIQLIDTEAEGGDLLNANRYYVAAYADEDVTAFEQVSIEHLN